MQEERIFTIGEANNLLPQLEEMLLEIKRERKLLAQVEAEVKKAGELARQDGGTALGPRYIKAMERITKDVEKINEMGVLVKDLERGLCDFPFLLEDRLVYLCWKLGEPEIGWWHETHTGYGGRQQLPLS
jgi:hypothetical protein